MASYLHTAAFHCFLEHVSERRVTYVHARRADGPVGGGDVDFAVTVVAVIPVIHVTPVTAVIAVTAVITAITVIPVTTVFAAFAKNG